MSRDWDIAGSERVFSTYDDITLPIAPSRWQKAELSSMATVAIVFGIAAVGARTDKPIMVDQFGGTSDLCIVVDRTTVPLKKGPKPEKYAGVDFSRGRSTKQLAHSFKVFFRPADDIDDSSEEGYVFR